MALINNKISELQAAVKDVDLPGSIKLPDTASLVGNALMSSACRYLRPGQGILLGSTPFTVKSVAGSSAVTVDEFKDRMGNRASIEKSDIYTDGKLLNLRNCAGTVVYSIDPTGTPILHSGLVARITERDVTIEAIQSGLVLVTGTEARLHFVTAPGSTETSSIDRLGFPNTLHEFRIINRGSDPMSLTSYDEGNRETAKVYGTIPPNSLATVSILIGLPTQNARTSFVVYLDTVLATKV